MTIAFMTDIFIMKNTNNKKSLDNVMELLYNNFAKQGKTHIKREQLSKPFVEKIIKHTKKSPFQGQTKVRDGKML